MAVETTVAIVFAVLGVVFTVVRLGLFGAGVWKLDQLGRVLGEQSMEETADEDPLETLRQRYAAGELTDEEFERKAERLVETEDRVDRERVSELE